MSHATLEPSAWITRFGHMVAPGTHALDVACGYGRHARWFAERGVNVTAVDVDALALASLAGVQNVTTELRDLEHSIDSVVASSDIWPYAQNTFDAIIVCNYLWRPTFERMLASLKPNGLLLYETFMAGHERYGRPTRTDFLLQPNELLERTRVGFQVIAFEEGEVRNIDGNVQAVTQRIAASKEKAPDSRIILV